MFTHSREDVSEGRIFLKRKDRRRRLAHSALTQSRTWRPRSFLSHSALLRRSCLHCCGFTPSASWVKIKQRVVLTCKLSHISAATRRRKKDSTARPCSCLARETFRLRPHNLCVFKETMWQLNKWRTGSTFGQEAPGGWWLVARWHSDEFPRLSFFFSTPPRSILSSLNWRMYNLRLQRQIHIEGKTFSFFLKGFCLRRKVSISAWNAQDAMIFMTYICFPCDYLQTVLRRSGTEPLIAQRKQTWYLMEHK